jgi:hypothetical protein
VLACQLHLGRDLLLFQIADLVPQQGGAFEFLPFHSTAKLALQLLDLGERPVFLNLRQ